MDGGCDTLKLRVLGQYAPYAPQEGACSGYLLQTSAGYNIMIDCGNGSFANLQKYSDYRLLNILIISHYHPDHFHDYHCVRHAIAGSIQNGTRNEPLLVFAPQEVLEPWEEMLQWDGVFELAPLEYLQEEELEIGDIFLKAIRNTHTVPCYSLCFRHGIKKIVYTSDTAWFDELVDFSTGADLLLCEASLKNIDIELSNEKGHLTAGQAGQLAYRAGAKRLVLTHFWPEYNLKELYDQAKEKYKNKVYLAQDGLLIKV